MKIATTLVTLATLFSATTALAASDLTVDVTSSQGDYVYDVVGFDVEVSNIGNRTAKNVAVTIDLPETNTSPTVYVMGNVVGFSSACSQSGTQLSCSLGRIRKGKSKSVWVDIELPESADSLAVSASVGTSSSENSTSNNDDTEEPSLLNYDVTIADGDLILNEHCTGMDLVSFYECVVSPGSISSHEAVYHGDGTISFPYAPPGYAGTWSQPTSDSLEFTYTHFGVPQTSFVGYGTSADCFEGVTVFLNSSYVAPYSVCIQ